MKKGAFIYQKKNGIYTEVNLKAQTFEIQYRYKTANKFTLPYLNLENLSYCVAESDEDEEDDYLLHHALQEDKKLCASFWTRNDQKICDIFKDEKKYCVVVKDTSKKGYKTVFVSRKGCLADYFDLDVITEWYESQDLPINLDHLMESMFQTQMIDIISGNYTFSAFGIAFNISINFMGDEVLTEYGPEGLVILGLLLGYPLESTAALIQRLLPYFIDNPRF